MERLYWLADKLSIFTSFAIMFAPATQTANAQSVTFGSFFPSFNFTWAK